MAHVPDDRALRTPRASQRQWTTHRKERDSERAPDLVIGVAASFTAEPLEPQLGAPLLDAGWSDPVIGFADYNQLHQVCLDPSSTLGADVTNIVLLWRIEDVFERPFARYLTGDDTARSEILDGVAELAALVVNLDATSPAQLVVSTPPHPAGWDVDLADVVTTLRVGRLHREAVSIWLDALAAAASVEIVDLDALQRRAGEAQIFDTQKWAMYRQPYGSDFWLLLGTQVAAAISRSIVPPPKCIVLDCDNTLWGGIVGEDGLGGLDLGDAFPGRAFQALQRELKMLRSRGVMLAVASKNDEHEVLDMFDRHEGMVLTRDDITAWRVNWQPKSVNIESIAAELNIGIDSLVLVDDSPYELDEVITALPGLRGLLVPEELAELPTLLHDSGLFRGLRVSGEDRQRTEMMRSEEQRRIQLASMDRADFLDSLELQVTFIDVADDHITRVAQLTSKTNQFNLTTIRRDEKQIRRLVDSDTNEVYAIRVTDRFGDYGIVGVAIIDTSADSWVIDTFLMSCRVLGRGVETAFLSAIADAAAARDIVQLVGRYEPTRKNSQVENFYAGHGFAADDTTPGTFTLDLRGARPQKPAHIDLGRQRMAGTGFDAFDFFADLFVLCLILVPAFYLLPWAWARRTLLTLAGGYLLFLVAPRLALFYLVFWLAIAGLQRLVAWSGEKRLGVWVMVSVVAVLAPMVIWKLFPADFTISFNVFFDARIFQVSNVAGSIDAIRPIILPIGLSFATFRAVDLLVQSFLGTVPVQPVGQVLFYGFFPPVQVIGPVIEYSEIAAQSRKTEGLTLDNYRAAFTQAVVGAVKLFVLTVPLASSVNLFFVYKTSPAWTLWVELFIYTWYFYLNFSGYSDLAIAVARVFGFKLKPNFSRPLTRPNPQDFWNSWNMSLTRFAQRNVFVPLGGMRERTQYIAIFATMMTIALWHDISVPLVIFGVYHSAGLIGARILNKRRPAATDPSRLLSTGKAVLLFTYVAFSLPLLTLRLGQLDSFYKALLGVR